MPGVDFGTGKTVFVLAIVVGCFAVLWPKIFYPMLQASVNPYGEEECCTVISERDANVIKVLRELCNEALKRREELYENSKPIQRDKLTKQVVDICREDVLQACGIDISILLTENPAISKRYMATLMELRSFNITKCLKDHFHLESTILGGPRRMRTPVDVPQHMRQERPPNIRPEMMHPALREKGRAIPQRTLEKEARPGPLPGVRPPLGGAGHVVPAPKGSGTMGVVMPLYTVGIVIFFVYTIMKVLLRKPDPIAEPDKDYPDPTSSVIEQYAGYTSDPYHVGDQGEYLGLYDVAHYSQQRKSDNQRQQSNKRNNANNKPQTTKLGRKERDAIVAAVRGLIQAVDEDIDRISEGKTKINEEDNKEHIYEDEISKQLPIHTDHAEEQTQENNKTDDKVCVEDVIITPITLQEGSEMYTAHENFGLTKTDSTDEFDEIRKDDTDIKAVSKIAREVVDQVLQEGHSHVASLKGHSRQSSNDSSKVAVVGVGYTAGLGSGRRWSPSTSPTPPRSHTPTHQHLTEDIGAIQSIFLEGTLPSATTQLMVSAESAFEELPGDNTDMSDDYDSAPVILSGKVTLSVLGLELSTSTEPVGRRSEATSLTSFSLNDESRRNRMAVHHSTLPEQDRLRELESAMHDENGRKRSSKASSPDLEDYEVIGAGATQTSVIDEDADKTTYATVSAGTTGNLTGAEETAGDVSVVEAFGDADEQEDREELPYELPPDLSTNQDEEPDDVIEEHEEDDDNNIGGDIVINGTLGTPTVGSIETLDSSISPGPDITTPPPPISSSSSINNFEMVSSSMNGDNQSSSFERLSVNGYSHPSTPLTPASMELRESDEIEDGANRDM